MPSQIDFAVPVALQGVAAPGYSAIDLRRMALAGVMQEGILEFGDYKVSPNGATKEVIVGSGRALVQGDAVADQGLYYARNSGNQVLSLANAPDVTNPRIDQVVLEIKDTQHDASGLNTARLRIVSGTATAGATLANLSGAAALPSSAIRLAYLLVPANAVKFEASNIGNTKDPRAGLTGYPASVSPLAVAGAPPQYAGGRPNSYVPTARAYANANQTPGASTACPMNSEVWDNEAIHDLVTNNSRLTCQTPGLYLIEAAANMSEAAEVAIGLNGAAAIDINGQTIRPSMAVVWRLAFSDFVILYEAAGKTFQSFGNESPHLSMTWMGP